jgi:NADH-quinone oxidoreductase subunit K
MAMTLTNITILAAILMTLGLGGIALNRRNIIAILMCMELMLLSVNLVFVGASTFRADVAGQVFTFFILTVAAAELAIGLAIVTLFFRNRGDVEIDSADMMKG